MAKRDFKINYPKSQRSKQQESLLKKVLLKSTGNFVKRVN
jgi:hypothetical protein